MKVGRVGFVLLVIWTLAVIAGGFKIYKDEVRPVSTGARAEAKAENFVSFGEPAAVEVVGCEPFALQNLADPTVILSPRAETPILDSRCSGDKVYRLDAADLSGKWQVRFSAVTMRPGTGSTVTVELDEAAKRTTLWTTIGLSSFMWLLGGALIAALLSSPRPRI